MGKKIMTAYLVTSFQFSDFLKNVPISCMPNTNSQQGMQPV